MADAELHSDFDREIERDSANLEADNLSPEGGGSSEAQSDSPTVAGEAPKTRVCKPDQTPGWKIALELVTVVVGLAVVTIYGKQLHVMQGQLTEMKGSSEQANRLLGLYQKQLEQITKQASDTHDLATAANSQAAASKKIAANAAAQALATNRLAQAAQNSASSESQQLDIMRSEFGTSQRAWLELDSSSIVSINYVDGTVRRPAAVNLTMTLGYTNVGNLPAVSIYTIAWLHFLNQNSDFLTQVKQWRADACNLDKKYQSLGGSSPIVEIVYPGKAKKILRSFSTPVAEGNLSPQNQIAPVLVGCLLYQYSSSPVVHEAGFIFDIIQKDKHNSMTQLTFGKQLPLDEVYLDDSWSGIVAPD